jgi:hypothetical protein
LVPFFSPICRVGTNGFTSQRRFDIRPVGCFPVPGYPLHLVIFSQTSQPQIAKNPGSCPLLKFAVGSGRTQTFKFLPRQSVPDDARPQYIHNCGKVNPIGILGLSAAACSFYPPSAENMGSMALPAPKTYRKSPKS